MDRVYSTEAPEDWLHIPLRVDRKRDGYRLDRFVHSRIRRLSRSRIQEFIGAGHVRREGEDAPLLRCATRVHEGEVLVLSRPAPEEPAVVLDYGVVHHGPDLLVIDKAAGLPVHPSGRYHRNTLTALMRSRLGDAHEWVMAHRLDRETSGVMVFGRRGQASASIKSAFSERRIHKRYLALCHGTLGEARRIDAPIAVGGSRIRIKMHVRDEADGGADARTDIEPLALGSFRGEPVTLVRALPRTGRQHQIRVHLAHIGHPVVGDKMYGLDEQWFIDITENGMPMARLDDHLGLSRHALHAEHICLPHPVTGDEVSFTAPWPGDLAALLPLPSPPRSHR